MDLTELAWQYARRGSAAYPASMMLGLLIYGYASGKHSSRKIERACHDSVAIRFVAANTHPTLRRFFENVAPSKEVQLSICLSDGLHEQTDEYCLEIATSVRTVLTEFV